MSDDRRTPRGRKRGGRGTGSKPVQTVLVAPQNAEILALLASEPCITLESGQVLFTEGDSPNSMYVVKIGTLRIRSGGVIYEDVGPGGIVGEMALVEHYPARSATVYALTDCELVAVDEAHFTALVAEQPHFALKVMRILSSRLRTMDRRYRPEPLIAREPLGV